MRISAIDASVSEYAETLHTLFELMSCCSIRIAPCLRASGGGARVVGGKGRRPGRSTRVERRQKVWDAVRAPGRL